MAKSSPTETPLMQQHRAIKTRYPDAILLFRVGDFYETFGADAIVAASVLGITLTKRNNGAASENELAGFPHHALDTYLHKLVKAGHRVAVCDQLEDPKQAKGIVKRGVTEMVTPGTATQDKLLEFGSNNFLASLHVASENEFGIALLDISTGEFLIAEGDREYIDKLLQSFKPAELIFHRQKQKLFKEHFGTKWYTYGLDEWIFQENYAQEILLKHFQTHSLKGFGVESMILGRIAAGAILHYLKDTEHPHVQHIVNIQRIDKEDFLWMDRFTIRNLELLQHGQGEGLSLLQVLDQTVSPMGARLLKRWIVFPLKERKAIEDRLEAVGYFIKDAAVRQQVQQSVKLCGDVERLVSKIPLKKISPREVLQLARGLRQVQVIQQVCSQVPLPYLQQRADAMNPCLWIAERIEKEMLENPAAMIQKGGVIAAGVDPVLDDLRKIVTNGKAYLLALQEKEANQTGIPSLKIGFNNVFGYYLEVTNTHKQKVPTSWIRKQTLANAERYITPELKEYEEKIMGAEDKILQLEYEHFEAILSALQEYIQPMQTNGHILAVLDCLTCFGQIAIQYRYRVPEIHEGRNLSLQGSRHPVIERQLPPGEPYIDNDIELDPDEQQIIILTGPNMSGKSALLRQTALITLMAHMGCFVPAERALIPLTDKIFTRVGASDNLSSGESTFMVEMNETASILNNITDKSLILLDEIGRGTSTYDGISIAWSIAEFLHQSVHQPKTLFATHYHELNELEHKFPRIRNYHISNKEVGNKVVFLRKLTPGGSTHSFGIHVARMAGMPPSLIRRANEILAQLEEKHLDRNPGQTLQQMPLGQMQLSIFDVHSQTFDEIRVILQGIDINRLTPVEALLKLQEIKQKIQ